MTDEIVDIDINDRVKSIRDKYSLKIHDIAEITGYSESSIRKWMIKRGEKSYTPAPIQALKLLKIWVDRRKEYSSLGGSTNAKQAEVWTVLTGKGGVGKTTVSFNLALILSNTYKKKTLALDYDPQGHLTLSLVKSPQNLAMTTSDLVLGKHSEPFHFNEYLDVIGTDKKLRSVLESIPPQDLLFRLKENIEEYKGKYDYIVCDGIPTDSPWFDSILAATTKIIMPVTADLYDSWGMQDVFDKAELLKMRKVTNDLKVAAIVANNMTAPISIFDKTIVDNIKENYPNEFCPTIISKSVKIKECKSPAISKSIVDYEPNSKVAKQYLDVVDFILKA